MKTYIIGSLVAWMLPREKFRAEFHPLTTLEARSIVGSGGIESAVRHAGIASVFQLQLGFPIEENRIQVVLGKEVRFLWGQYSGPTLSEQTKELPRNAKIEWWLVSVTE